ncbi:MAG: hypothetical protein LAO56_22530 [Acidobacteriia bacterium]|nr:hypothetical protein [Terriglobia bacterium]
MRKLTKLGIAFVSLSGVLWAGTSYQIRLASLTSVHVDASFDAVPGDKLFMETGASGQENGFAPFVKTISASSADGDPVSLSREGATWSLPASTRYPIRVSYEVDLSFVASHWPVGNEQAGYTDGKATFVVSKALFLDCKAPGQRLIRFFSPEPWRVATPWTKTGDTYIASSSDDLLRNTLIFGDIKSTTAEEGPFSFEIVGFGVLATQQSNIRDGLSATVRQCIRLFPGTPKTQYLITLIPGAEDDGESYLRGFASTLRVPLQDWQRMVWLNTIAHELTHYWIGGLMQTREGMDWFDEGFTEYYANLGLVRGGVITPQQFVQKMERHLAAYLYFMASPLYSGISVEGAGQRKGAFRFGVYDGGWTLAWALDLKIREATQNRKSLDDVMELIFADGRRSNTPVSLETISSAASSVLGGQADEFLKHFVRSRNELDIAGLLGTLELDSVGQSYAGELYIKIKGPSPLRESWARF